MPTRNATLMRFLFAAPQYCVTNPGVEVLASIIAPICMTVARLSVFFLLYFYGSPDVASQVVACIW